MTIEYPRGICKNEEIQCDLCNKWSHIECVGISSAYYEKLQNDTKPCTVLTVQKNFPSLMWETKTSATRYRFSQPLKHISLMYQIKSLEDLCINSTN